MRASRWSTVSILLAAGCVAPPVLAEPPEPAELAGPAAAGGLVSGPTDDYSAADQARLWARIEAARARLSAEGRLPRPDPLIVTALAWPLRSAGVGYSAHWGTSAFVDQDTDAGQILDYDCGARTYDQHRGTDFFTWPYGWLSMDLSRLQVLAAAPGTILLRADGNYDRSCSSGSGNANLVVVQHADGSTAIYGHFKNGSVTPKQVGESVATGEILGVVGSSGSSNGPHLHFEVHDSGTYPGPLLDPFDGVCEALALGSLWIQQPAYRQPTINHLATGFPAPVISPPCPTPETPNEKRIFASGATIYFTTFLHDETPDFPKALVIRRPDGSLFHSWSHTAAAAYNASYAYWSFSFPGAPTGRWSFAVTLDGVTRERAFWIGVLFAEDFEDGNLAAWSAATP